MGTPERIIPIRQRAEIDQVIKQLHELLQKQRDLHEQMRVLIGELSAAPEVDETYRDGELIVHFGNYTLWNGVEFQRLTKSEHDLLRLYTGRPGKVFSRREILDRIWTDRTVTDRVVDVFTFRIKRKILDSPGRSRISAVKGAGYVFTPRGPEASINTKSSSSFRT